MNKIESIKEITDEELTYIGENCYEKIQEDENE